MYSYTYDRKTGGILLNSSPTGFSKEPRPVYAAELDVLGFDEYWKYDKQTELPYMWAEANTYWYRGVCVAKLKGGNLYTAPEIVISTDENDKQVSPEPNGNALRHIDIPAMVAANREMLEIIEQTTVKKILAIYEKYKGKLDLFHVAFSGGKDSTALLDLVKKALPKGSFVAVFGDTGMEFPDTYDVIEKNRQACRQEEIPFYTAKSHLDPKQSWKLFGPPSRVLRWCCSVHKSTPQILKLREVTGKDNYVGLDFVGVRAQESIVRSEYEYENYGKKQKGQYSHNSILEWTSAEVWLYIYANNLIINETYKKGNPRAGCLFCPMSGGISNYMRRSSYTAEIDEYVQIIKDTNEWDKHSKINTETYITNGGWENRRSGRGINGNFLRYKESTKNGVISIELISPISDWHEWSKTVDDKGIQYIVKETQQGWLIQISELAMKESPAFGKIFRQAFRKAAYCSSCKVCETNCKNGRISFETGKVKITNCIRCLECHDLPGGCHMYNSLKMPQGEKKMKAINCFDDHAPKLSWLVSFFKDKEKFFEDNDLGPNQFTHFKRFLRDANLVEKNSFSAFAELISQIGWESDTAQGLILINLVAENTQLEWYVKNLDIGINYSKKTVEELLLAIELKVKAARSVVKSFKRIVETPLGTTLHFGYVSDNGDLVRSKCFVTDPIVVLYGLFKFAEKCNDFKEFTLATLLNDSIDRDGVSPTRIFGLDRDDMIPLLLGLSAKYPEFITASFTHDLEKITLSEDKTSSDVIELFKGGITNG